jgi:hypothetical protein
VCAERDADDVEAAGEPIEGNGADVVGGGAERGPVGVFGVRRREGGGDEREEAAEDLADYIAGSWIVVDGLTQKLDAVGDVARLVVVDLL